MRWVSGVWEGEKVRCFWGTHVDFDEGYPLIPFAYFLKRDFHPAL